MRIDPNEPLLGFPILQVRRLLRYGRNRLGVDMTARLLSIPRDKAEQLLEDLFHQGYIEPAELGGRPWWQNTIQGQALAMAKAGGSPSSRSVADRIFAEFMARVRKVNEDPYFLYKVTKVVLFGSYLTDAPQVNDIDVAVELVLKEQNPQRRHQLMDARIREAQEQGREFSTIADLYGWPEREVQLFLKSRSRVLSLHQIDDPILRKSRSRWYILLRRPATRPIPLALRREVHPVRLGLPITWRSTYPGAAVGILVMHNVANPEHHDALDRRKEELERQIRSRFADRSALLALQPIQAYNAYFKRYDKTYHVQLQLESVALKGKAIPRVAALVEAMFMAELKNLLLTAGHDLTAIQMPVRLDVVTGSEQYVRLNGQEQRLKAGDMLIADAQGVISSVLYGPDQRTRITPATCHVLFAAYAPPGIGEQAVHQHLQDIQSNVLLVSPEAEVELLKVYGETDPHPLRLHQPARHRVPGVEEEPL